MPYRDKQSQDEGDLYTGSRVCKKCDLRKPMEKFHWASKKTCRRRKCKSCTYSEFQARLAEDPTKIRAIARAAYLKKNYGITLEEELAMLAACGNRCEICKKEIPNKGDWRIDHDHETGAVRGILCNQCNLGIGMLQDSQQVMLAAIQYLKDHNDNIERSVGPGASP